MNGTMPFVLEKSGEEGVGMLKALLGLGDLVTNVNFENTGQIANLPVQCSGGNQRPCSVVTACKAIVSREACRRVLPH